MCSFNVNEYEILNRVFDRPDNPAYPQILEISYEKIVTVLECFRKEMREFPFTQANRNVFLDICEKYDNVFKLIPKEKGNFIIRIKPESPEKIETIKKFGSKFTKSDNLFLIELGKIINSNINKWQKMQFKGEQAIFCSII